MLLQGILRRAVVRGLIPANPVSVVDKPRQPPTRRPQPLIAQDLREWLLALGGPPARTLIFPRQGGTAWQLHDWQNWRRRVYQPAAAVAGVGGDMRPYRLRSSFVSLLLWEGRSLTYVADEAEHSVATLAAHYAGVLRELEDQPREPAATVIQSAREATRCAPGVRQARAEKLIGDREPVA